MKQLFTLFFLALVVALPTQAQEAIKHNGETGDVQAYYQALNRQRDAMRNTRTVICGPDTNTFTISRATAFRSVFTAQGSVTGLAQFFPASTESPITVSGFDFFAIVDSALDISVNVTANIYNLGADSLPTGAPVATTTISVDTTGRTQGLGARRRFVSFTAPVTLTNNFAISVEYSGAADFLIATSDFVTDDGKGEYLLSGLLGANWLRGFDLAFSPTIDLDADAFFFPHLTYDVTAGIEEDNSCLIPGEAGQWISLENSAVTSMFYNVLANPDGTLSGPPVLWDLGNDRSVAGDTLNASFAAAGDSVVKVFSQVVGGSRVCIDSAEVTVVVRDAPMAGFTSTVTDDSVSITDGAANADSVKYDFGDGTTSTDASPSHTYNSIGEYTITQVVFGCDRSDTTTEVINITTASINDALSQSVSVYPNPSQGIFQIELINGQVGELKLSVSNLYGQQVAQASGTQRATLDLRGQTPGVYLLQGTLNGESFTRKLILD